MTSMALAACGGSPANKVEEKDDVLPLEVAVAGSTLLTSPIFVAQYKGFFTDAGVDYKPEQQQNYGITVSSVVSGKIPLGLGTMFDVIQANATGKHVVAVAGLANGFPNTLLLSSDVAKKLDVTRSDDVNARIRALKGLKIATSGPGQPTDTVSRLMLKDVGLDPDRDVELVASSTPDAVIAAIKSGKTDAGIVSSPQSDQAIKDGYAIDWINFTKGEYEPVSAMNYVVLYGTAKNVDANPELVQRSLNAIAQAERYIQSNKQDAADAMAAEFKTFGAELYQSSYNSLYPSMPASPVLTREGYEAALKIMQEGDPSAKLDVSFEDAVNNTYAEKSVK